MARLHFDDYRRHLETESARLRAVLVDCDPLARVPGCPEWTASDLLGHHGGVLEFWATIIERRPEGPDELEEPSPPASYADRLAFHEQQAARLVAALDAADPGEHAWTWSGEQTVGFTFRRQAHEALIHRLDAEQTAGRVTPLDPELAADGVDECLDVMFGGAPPWGSFAPLPHHVRVEITDRDESLWVQIGRFTGTDPSGEQHDVEDIRVVPAPGGDADAVVSGPSAELDAWLWRRGDDSQVVVTGDRGVYDRFRVAVNQPID
ncbi:maleylpyruvate isomerase family mycothiol-dependent enzyme [Nocardioides sp. URHA0020]|uniref:maleylpyruvate isomerase family mycothiol-dependent enzyme n=1 Tax=Nocardioides sp. URHA0020 TaxID=1380392 RepID=UPI00049032DD|nr:maleylpyruvate isomerase family mycothiol-dependent enzyme [Nocardioides sp. URHA0020]